MSETTKVERDEYYPFYILDCDYRGAESIDVPAAMLTRWRRVMDEFNRVQCEIHAAWLTQTTEGQRHAKWHAEHQTEVTGDGLEPNA